MAGLHEVFDSVPHSERTYAPMNNVTFNVRFTCNHVKDLELVDVDTKKKRFFMYATSKRRFGVKSGSMIRTVIKLNTAHIMFAPRCQTTKKPCKTLHFKWTNSECFVSSKTSTLKGNDDQEKNQFYTSHDYLAKITA